jgi:hypothetical protein
MNVFNKLVRKYYHIVVPVIHIAHPVVINYFPRYPFVKNITLNSQHYRTLTYTTCCIMFVSTYNILWLFL